MSGARVLLTGAFGNVGSHVRQHLIEAGHDVHAFDVANDGNQKRAASATGRFTPHWGDLRDPQFVDQLVAEVRPEVVLHTAALIAPLAFLRPEVAEAVNIGGTRALIDACERLDDAPRFVFTSSYTVHGPRNPYRDLPPIDEHTPVAPADPYAKHKVEGEKMLAASSLPWTVLRLPAILPTDPSWGRDPTFLTFLFLLSPDRKEHLLDSRDAALALANCVEADGITHRTLPLGGPPSDCQVRGIEFHHRAMAALGLRGMSEHVFRYSHPDVDASWYAEDWVDTTASQQLLDYQRNTFADHLAFRREQAGFSYWPSRVLAPAIRLYLQRQTPWPEGPPQPDATPMWEATQKAFDLV